MNGIGGYVIVAGLPRLQWMTSVSTSTPAAATTPAWITPVELIVLGAVWGASFMFMRVAVPSFGPFALVEVRLALGALVLLPFLLRERGHFTGRIWLRIAGISAINSALPFVLFAWGAERAPAGIGAISNATTAMFAAIIAVLFFGERIQGRRILGLIAGFVGVVVLASGKTEGNSVWMAALAGTLAALMYGIGMASASISRGAISAGCRPVRSRPPTCCAPACGWCRWPSPPGPLSL
jgi:drug/metabolite transporter (DMT)-like permease